MSTRSPRRRAARDRPPSGVHPVATRDSFLLLAADPQFGAWLAEETRAHGEVTIAATIDSALSHRPRGGHWTAALLDVDVPDGSGFTVLDALRLGDTELPVLMFSDSERGPTNNVVFAKRASLLIRPVPPGHVQMFLDSPLVLAHGAARHAIRPPTAPAPPLEVEMIEISGAWRARYHLTSTEGDVLHLALQGLERAEMADRRAVSENTIKSQVNRLLSKTGCISLAELTSEAMREILLNTPRARL